MGEEQPPSPALHLPSHQPQKAAALCRLLQSSGYTSHNPSFQSDPREDDAAGPYSVSAAGAGAPPEKYDAVIL